MSAFLCGKDHIDLLVSHCADQWFHGGKWVTLHDTPRTEVGRILVAENITSLRCRYPDGDWWAADDKWHDNYMHTPVTEHVSPEQVIRACDCLEYQSCEHPEWPLSEAKAILVATRNHYVERLVDRDEDAQWVWQRSQFV